MNWHLTDLTPWVTTMEWLFLLYFIGMNGGYTLLNLVSLVGVRRYLEARALDALPHIYSGFELPVSVLVPACNEEATIAASVRSLLQFDYPEFEVVVVNDGSTDGTLAVLTREFALAPFPEAYWKRLPVQSVRGIYRSAMHPNLRVLDKVNGGKADALNAGINAARFPLYCAVDANLILQPDSLKRAVQPFLQDPNTMATATAARVANGCTVNDGFIAEVELPGHPLALIQVIEYLRACLFGRLGWSPPNAVLIVSGAFGVYKKEAVVAAGGYRCDSVDEDMELVLRLHRLNRLAGRPYRITFVPDPIVWTEVPESLGVLATQRVRWQRGLAESLLLNIRLLFHPRGGAAGWAAFPFTALFEWWGPLFEVLAYVLMTAAWFFGLVSAQAFVAFMLAAIGMGIMVSVSALLIDELSFHIYHKPGQLAWLLGAVIMENCGYRQLVALWRLAGLASWLAQSAPRGRPSSAVSQPHQATANSRGPRRS
ncbi:MAG TPA: glycosyltransferase [Burkholderiales bacterium]|nr:glycosyltransferase [Burkholderiales bacterium]